MYICLCMYIYIYIYMYIYVYGCAFSPANYLYLFLRFSGVLGCDQAYPFICTNIHEISCNDDPKQNHCFNNRVLNRLFISTLRRICTLTMISGSQHSGFYPELLLLKCGSLDHAGFVIKSNNGRNLSSSRLTQIWK